MILEILYLGSGMGFITNAIKSIKITFYLVERSLIQLDDFLLVHTKIELGHFKIRKNWIDARSDIPVATFVRSGYPVAQEVKIDLLFLFMTF